MRYWLLLFFFVQSSLYADVLHYEVSDFEQISQIYTNNDLNYKESLLVFDIDDTLLTTTQALGGVGWWDWQAGLLKNNPTSEQLFVKNIAELVSLQNLLFHLVKMEVTDEHVIPFIKQAIDQQATVLGLTARGSEHLSVTMSQLLENNFLDNNQLLFDKAGLKLITGTTSSAGALRCPQFKSYVTYYLGVAFLNGEDKGKALLCMLNQSIKSFKTIVFVDDVQHNLDSMADAFKDNKNVLLINILYSKENNKEQTFLSNQLLQAAAYDQWMAIRNTLKQNIQNTSY